MATPAFMNMAVMVPATTEGLKKFFRSLIQVEGRPAVLPFMESKGALPDRTIVDRLKQRTTYLRTTEVMALLHATRAPSVNGSTADN